MAHLRSWSLTVLFGAFLAMSCTANESRDAETSKAVVKTFFSRLDAGAFDTAFTAVDDDVIWWIPGTLPFSGERTKEQYLQIVGQIQAGFPNGLSLKLESMIAEGELVAAEVESRGTHVSGTLYNNRYHFLIRVVDGRIVHVKEYMDTLHLYQLLTAAPGAR